MTQRPGGQPDGAGESRAEEVLAQALGVMAGGGKVPAGRASGADQRSRRRLSTGQLVLLVAIVGLLIGIGAGFLSLML